MTNSRSLKRSAFAGLHQMNKNRVDQDMATLVNIFHKLSKGRSNDAPFPEEEETPHPFCSSSLIKSFIESFPCRDAAQLCFEHATHFAESFDINQLLNHEPTDLVHDYLQIKSTIPPD